MVKVVVLNYNGGGLTLNCLDSLNGLEWPADRLDVVVVDNGSSDGSADMIRQAHPWARIIASEKNLGFAGGNNLALSDLNGFDYVALLNNDTTVEPGWLKALVGALEADPDAGAACSKILLDGRFQEVTLGAATTRSHRFDTRRLGLQLSGVEVDGTDRWESSQFLDGWSGPEFGGDGRHGFRWSTGPARLRVPVGRQARLRLGAVHAGVATLESGADPVTIAIGQPQWFTIPLAGEPVTVVNNAGNQLLSGGYCADRGYLEADLGQYQLASEVFGWCGASVLLRSRYLHDVGLFDERLFLYYEDFDLSWRGRAQGWRYVYTPDSVVHHVHSATAGEGTPLSAYYVERNRLLVLTKNAPASMALKAVERFVLTTASYLRRDLLSPTLGGDRRFTVPARRVHAFGGYLARMPAMAASRRALRRRQAVPDRDVLAWADSPGPRAIE
jgi:GT2 family glycosyltransferase